MSSSLQLRQSQALARLEQDPQVQHMLAIEPDLKHVMTIAANQNDGDTRWYAYTALKEVMNGFVGWDARNPHLRESLYWEKMIKVIDELLPDEEEQDTSPRLLQSTALDQNFQDALNAWKIPARERREEEWYE